MAQFHGTFDSLERIDKIAFYYIFLIFLLSCLNYLSKVALRQIQGDQKMDIFEIVLSHVVSIFFIFSFGCNLWIINFLYTEVISKIWRIISSFHERNYLQIFLWKYFQMNKNLFGNGIRWILTIIGNIAFYEMMDTIGW